MKKIAINAAPRTDLTKTFTKSLRKRGQVPAVIYGNEGESIPCIVSMVEIAPVIDTLVPHFIELTLEGKTYLTIINEREVQYHPVSGLIWHVDFLRISENHPIKMEIPVTFTGQENAPGLLQGGELAVKMRTLWVEALPKNMPEVIPVDVSALKLGQKITIKAAPQDNYTILNQMHIPLAVVNIPRALRSQGVTKDAE